MSNSNQVSKLYKTVVEDVINNVKEAFLDEGVDELILQELKQLWDSKLTASKALEPPPSEADLVLGQNMMMLPQGVQPAGATHGATQPQQAQTQQTPIPAAQQFHQQQATAQAQAATLALPSGLFQQQIATIGATGQIQNITVQQTGNGQFITLAGISPQLQQQLQQQQLQQQQQRQPQQQRQIAPQITPQMLQQQQQIHLQQGTQLINPAQSRQQPGLHNIVQLDGLGDTSSDDDDDDDLDEDKDDEEDKDEENEEEGEKEEEEPLNSDDDVSEDDPNELFDTENVVVCQYDKINRNKNKWKFYLKDGIMTLNGRDFVFQKANGDAEW